LVAGKPGIQFNGHEAGDGELILKHAGKFDFEGIVSKTISAPYAPRNRGLWRKAKWLNRQEFVIVGWSDPEGTRPYLGALLLGYYADDGKLIYAGRVGTGMPVKVFADLRRRLDPLTRKTSPLSVPPPRSMRFGSPLVLSYFRGHGFFDLSLRRLVVSAAISVLPDAFLNLARVLGQRLLSQ
jgi:ATP-dependent DNA ligase